MSAEGHLEKLAGSVLDGAPVDWSLEETRAGGADEEAALRALRDLERIASHSRTPQRRFTNFPEQWGHLSILELASAGNTGEIWRAWDTWLQREVALKFLFTRNDGGDDTALLEEARALARVRHPGVVAVYGIGEHEGRIGMWMELLPGHTLEAELERRGPLPPQEVAEIGLELCRALEAVVAAGLVHRDIKPANIIRESSGRIVLTDFGLGKRRSILDRESLRPSGTPVFMSPERLAGEPATPRSDLYALGVTLRWALTGRCPFRARTLEELKLEAEAGPSQSLSAERPDAPPALIAAIERAMAPGSESRYAGPRQLAEALREALDESVATAGARAQRRRMAVAALAVVLVGAAALFVPRLMHRPTPAHPVRFTVGPPPGLGFNPTDVYPTVSPDGRLLVFLAQDSTGGQRLWIRPLDSLAARVLEGTDWAQLPFWSPDSRSVAFFADAKLKKISITGGPPEVICSAIDARGGAWGKDGVIVFAPSVSGPLCRVSAEGGAVTEIQRPDSSRNETALRWPQFLPDGKRFFFVALPPREDGFDVFVASTDSGERRRVMTAGCAPICAGKKGIIFATNGRLMFQKFDYGRLRPVGSPIALGIAPFSDLSVGAPLASASLNGVLSYLSEHVTSTRLVWLDRSGNRVGTLPVPEGRYEKVYFAPDGKRLLADRRSSPTTVDLWMIDVEGAEARRFSQGSQSRLGGGQIWSPDGTRIAFNSNRSGRTYIYQKLADEPGEEELLYQSPGQFNEAVQWSPDGRFLVLERTGQSTGWDLWLLSMEGKHEATPYLQTRFNELGPAISPDGRWMAYVTDVTGKSEVYVRSFPKPGVERLASNLRGTPIWAKSGRELFLSDVTGLWSVPVSTTPTFRAGKPRLLFRGTPETMACVPTPEGDRFLAIRPSGDGPSDRITVDLNFLARSGL